MVDLYQLAVARIKGLGNRAVQTIISNLGSPKALFELGEKDLRFILGTKEQAIQDILSKSMFDKCEKELEFMQKYNINSYFYTDENYPNRLKQINDKPICLFVQGDVNFEYTRMAAVVGSRKYSDYGKDVTEQVVEQLHKLGVYVVSGLAYGIDSIAHTYSLNKSLPTIAVMATGLDTIYPREHKELAERILQSQGCAIVTEYFTGTSPLRFNFPARNRIIAGLVDLVIVVEASKTGGALLTAKLANDYNREVIAVPGRIDDKNSEGCNFLINSNRAHIMSNLSVIGNVMAWNEHNTTPSLFKETKEDRGINLRGLEKKIYYTLKDKGEMDIDTLLIELAVPFNDLSSSLLNMELCDLVLAKPGRVYKVI